MMPTREEIEAALREGVRGYVETRASTRDVAVRAMRSMERFTTELLDGGHLRGLPNIAPSRVRAWHGLRITHTFERSLLPADGREVLAMDSRGFLVAARADFKVETRAVRDEELVFEDLEPYARALAWALEQHSASTDRRTEQAEKVERAARRILAVIEEESADNS